MILASKKKLLSLDELIANIQRLKLPLEEYGVSLLENLTLLKEKPDWNQKARVMTDQFAPANLLQGK